jgi:3-methylcrotonyl-CoA carboxylase alpha subunit
MKFKVKLNNQEEEIEVVRRGDLLQVTRSGTTTELRLLHADSDSLVLTVEQEGLRPLIKLAGYATGDRRQLWVNGRTLTYERVRPRPALESGTAATVALSATIPAVVSEILVREGDQVAAGDKLILLESMKMIMPIQAPYAGVVKAIHCAAGAAVQPGVQLIELEQALAS